MKNLPDSNLSSEKKTIDLSIKLLLILLLVAWSIMIIIPFLTPMLWGGILAITLFPLYTGLLKLLKGKKGSCKYHHNHTAAWCIAGTFCLFNIFSN